MRSSHLDRSTISFLGGLALVLAAGLVSGCEDQPCSAQGTCPGSFVCDPSDRQCKFACTNDEGCAADELCVESLGLCRAGTRLETPDLGTGDVGSSCERGLAPCQCFSDGTCQYGFKCKSGQCASVAGALDQPCNDDATCDNAEHECLEGVCRRRDQGAIGQSCFARVPPLGSVRCRSEIASCVDEICLGEEGAACVSDAECVVQLSCFGGSCAKATPGLCDSVDDCSSGQMCCGEVGSRFAQTTACGFHNGTQVTAGACFPAPEQTFGQTCVTQSDCDRAPTLSPDPTGVSLCMPWRPTTREAICSAPCLPDAEVSGCPSQWSCSPGFLGCTVDADCGGKDLRCVGANASLGYLGRCQCGEASKAFGTCPSVGRGAAAGAECVQDGPSGDAFCARTWHCQAPGLETASLLSE